MGLQRLSTTMAGRRTEIEIKVSGFKVDGALPPRCGQASPHRGEL